MTSQDVSDSRPQSPERGLSDGEGGRGIAGQESEVAWA